MRHQINSWANTYWVVLLYVNPYNVVEMQDALTCFN